MKSITQMKEAFQAISCYRPIVGRENLEFSEVKLDREWLELSCLVGLADFITIKLKPEKVFLAILLELKKLKISIIIEALDSKKAQEILKQLKNS